MSRSIPISFFDQISELFSSTDEIHILQSAINLGCSALEILALPVTGLMSAFLQVFRYQQDELTLQFGPSFQIPGGNLHVTLSGKRGLIGEAMTKGKPVATRNLQRDIELGQILALRSCRSAFCIPLCSGLERCGMLLFAHPEAYFFSPKRRQILWQIGQQTVIALRNAQAYQNLQRENQRILEIQEEWRKKMAHEIHDGPTQSVAAIAMRVNFARRLLDRNPTQATEELQKIEELARRTTKEIRHMLFTLRPLVLESQGLIAALESMVEKMQDTFNQTVILQADPAVINQIEMGHQSIIFYIAEEAISNARKHAKAQHIWVRLNYLSHELALLAIEDDGIGFEIKPTQENFENWRSMGLVNMQERAELVNGVLQIESSPANGTHIRVLIPLSDSAAEKLHQR